MASRRKTFIIAEVGVNHNGDIELARRLIDVAAEAGADAVKFQTFRAEHVVTRSAPKAEYQTRTTEGSDSQWDMIRKLELSDRDHELLVEHATSLGISFLSTPFDLPSLRLLTERLKLDTVKIPSGEITNLPFLLAIARAAKQVILSTGMATLGEVEAALGALAFGFSSEPDARPAVGDFDRVLALGSARQLLQGRVTIMHCTTEYPAPFAEINLRAIDTMARAFGLPVGYSDHTLGIHVALAAVARGACMIEKHFTLDRSLPGPDHSASIEPSMLSELVRQIREVEQALGDGVKMPSESEWRNRDVARRSIVASREIDVGELFSEQNVTCKRPGTGISAAEWYRVIGRPSPARFSPDDLIEV